MTRLPLPLVLLLLALTAAPAAARTCDVVADCGAVADNATDAAPALSACAVACAPNAELLFPPGAQLLSGSVDLSGSRNLTLRFGAGSGLWGSGDPAAYPVQPALPWQGSNATQWRALLYGRNMSGLTITGPRSARVDGCGWPWWANFTAGTLAHQRPKLVELVDAEDVVLEGLTFANSPFWTLHPIFARRVRVSGVAVLAPRAVGNTDGIDPDSVTDCLIEDCLVDVGDDGISVKSGQHDVTGDLLPSRNILIVNTTVLSRNVAIGSACFGNITNVTMVGGRIGDDAGSSPWALKIKTHVPLGGVVSGVTLRGVALGAIAPNSYQQPKGGTAVQVLLNQYGSGSGGDGRLPPPAGGWPPGAVPPSPSRTVIEGVSLVDVHATSAVSAGEVVADAGFNVTGLTFDGVTFGRVQHGWACTGVPPNSSTVAGANAPAIPAACGAPP